MDRPAPVIIDELPAAASPPIRGLVAMSAVFWISSFAVLAVGDMSRAPDRALAIVGMRIALTALGMGFCLLIHLLLRRLHHRGFRDRVIALVIVAPVCAELFAWANYFGMEVAFGVPVHVPAVNLASAIGSVMQFTWLFLAWAGFYFALYYSAESEAKERRAGQLRVLAQQAQLQALAYQINPHFLFNSLNAVSALMLDGRIADAEQIVTRLARFLRHTLALDPTSDITLGQEVAIQREYLAIEQQRFPDLAAEFQIPEALVNARLPALSLQPLVENAVKHGVARSAPPTWIRIAASADEEQLEVTVENGGGGQSRGMAEPDGAGVGLANVRDRLARLFGERGRLAAGRLDDGTFRAVVSLPLSVLR
ncbi:histidine kinase [Sphingomonas sp. BT-65]|uniref:sensor histidine kinase n=1 Tax=Sphingomonas sp. BT-65 TaxID=2989821 RepID=UPI002235B1DD|nr:histidine kinase [Sphingomonas sp. BT-65]MCW4463532.1 histidine kinase [Sphingomonas sp. BT-65]